MTDVLLGIVVGMLLWSYGEEETGREERIPIGRELERRKFRDAQFEANRWSFPYQGRF